MIYNRLQDVSKNFGSSAPDSIRKSAGQFHFQVFLFNVLESIKSWRYYYIK